MLYDKRWDAKIATDPMTLPSLIAWLEQQPADKGYCYTAIGHCLLAQYLTAKGYANVSVAPGIFHHGPDRARGNYPWSFDDIASAFPHTFGAALKRARALAEKQSAQVEN